MTARRLTLLFLAVLAGMTAVAVPAASAVATYHGAALTTSYLSMPDTGDRTGETSASAYPHEVARAASAG